MPNEMRERLVELLANSGCAADAETFEELADHLLTNGVIVPPCNVGDTVWVIDCGLKIERLRGCEVISVVMDKYSSYVVVEEKAYKRRWSYQFSDFGQLVFLNKEEAEKKLKEHIQNG